MSDDGDDKALWIKTCTTPHRTWMSDTCDCEDCEPTDDAGGDA